MVSPCVRWAFPSQELVVACSGVVWAKTAASFPFSAFSLRHEAMFIMVSHLFVTLATTETPSSGAESRTATRRACAQTALGSAVEGDRPNARTLEAVHGGLWLHVVQFFSSNVCQVCFWESVIDSFLLALQFTSPDSSFQRDGVAGPKHKKKEPVTF